MEANKQLLYIAGRGYCSLCTALYIDEELVLDDVRVEHSQLLEKLGHKIPEKVVDQDWFEGLVNWPKHLRDVKFEEEEDNV